MNLKQLLHKQFGHEETKLNTESLEKNILQMVHELKEEKPILIPKNLQRYFYPVFAFTIIVLVVAGISYFKQQEKVSGNNVDDKKNESNSTTIREDDADKKVEEAKSPEKKSISPTVSKVSPTVKQSPMPTNQRQTIQQYPTATPTPRTSFILKQGVTNVQNDQYRDVYISWEFVPDATSYTIYLKEEGNNFYTTPLSFDWRYTSTNVTLKNYRDYNIKVQMCTSRYCLESNEITVSKLSQSDVPRSTFILKQGVTNYVNDSQMEVYLTWEEVPGTVKYNVYMRNNAGASYEGAAIAGVGEPRYNATVNRTIDNYFIVKACNPDSCITSNEIMVPRQ